MKKLKGKLKGDELIIIKSNGKKYTLTVGELLSNCIDFEYGKRLEKMMKALEARISNYISKP